jgi:Ca2+-binding EF-hand superfamily protein
MGNEPSKDNSRLGVCAMAFTTTNIEKAEFLLIAEKMKQLPDLTVCNRDDFNEAIKSVTKFEESDIELFSRLFVMFDNTGESLIPIKEYLAGVGGCLCSGTVVEKLTIAMELYDLAGAGVVDRADMKKILNSINLVTSYFGDPVVAPAEIERLTYDTFQKNPEPSAPMSIASAVPHIAGHDITDAFTSGRGSVKFGR